MVFLIQPHNAVTLWAHKKNRRLNFYFILKSGCGVLSEYRNYSLVNYKLPRI